ncbi:hypothetical protein RO3G_16341 [Lichtheimia corymbifera JMRC:FSU:9682]|uniref:N-terminal of MaoC-like dehydratase domain-containing protein n=1 Tax=Lichtheimia corymbifera JMRC:FSU:9682 TaxID=1263082 RepID=A0A068RV27_9FUNG|nr:hypothetical protein RO3G_16341 [Lichtheimia corymbifera JMRC:FSU:9682]
MFSYQFLLRTTRRRAFFPTNAIRTLHNASLEAWRSTAMETETCASDVITSSPLNLLANTLDEPSVPFKHAILPAAGTVVPATYHHIYFPPRTVESELAADGFENDFHPPEPFVERMWAGARLEFNPVNPLRVGDEATMVTTVNRIETKQGGRLGDSVLVWLDKDIHNAQGWAVHEQRCLVYATNNHHASPRMIKARKPPSFSKTICPSPILLFRYSALTFNAHRIHYDHPYATQREHHPDRLVHGPLSGTLLMTLLRTHVSEKHGHLNETRILSFDYRCLMPLYVDKPLTLCGRQVSDTDDNQMLFDLWIVDHDNNLAVKGNAVISNKV